MYDIIILLINSYAEFFSSWMAYQQPTADWCFTVRDEKWQLVFYAFKRVSNFLLLKYLEHDLFQRILFSF